MEIKSCPIWQTPAKDISDEPGRDGVKIDSPRAGGQYFVARSAIARLEDLDVSEKIMLTSGLVRERLSVFCPKITSFHLSVGNMRALTMEQRVNYLLKFLQVESDLLGTIISFDELDNGRASRTSWELLAWTASIELSEVITLAEYCAAERFIKYHTYVNAREVTVHDLTLWPPGYERVEHLS